MSDVMNVDLGPYLMLILVIFLLGFGATFAVAYIGVRRVGGLSRLAAGALAFLPAVAGGVVLVLAWNALATRLE